MLCLSITRTLSLIRPFQRQKIKYLLIAIVSYLLLIFASNIGVHNVVYIAPAFVVATSCILTAVLLTRRNNVAGQQELQQSRNRATVTILLFALVYGVCNVPLVVHYILFTYAMHTDSMEWFHNLYQFDTQYDYMIAIDTVLIAVNSAANPILYFWRMPGLREFFKGILLD